MKIYRHAISKKNYYLVPDIVTKFISKKEDQCFFSCPFIFYLIKNEERSTYDVVLKCIETNKPDKLKDFFITTNNDKFIEEISLDHFFEELSKTSLSSLRSLQFISSLFRELKMSMASHRFIGEEFEKLLKETNYYKEHSIEIEENVKYFFEPDFYPNNKVCFEYNPVKYSNRIFLYKVIGIGSTNFYFAEDFFFLNTESLGISPRYCTPLSEYELLFTGFKKYCVKKRLYTFINSIVKNKNKFKSYNYKLKIREHFLFEMCMYQYFDGMWSCENN